MIHHIQHLPVGTLIRLVTFTTFIRDGNVSIPNYRGQVAVILGSFDIQVLIPEPPDPGNWPWDTTHDSYTSVSIDDLTDDEYRALALWSLNGET